VLAAVGAVRPAGRRHGGCALTRPSDSVPILTPGLLALIYAVSYTGAAVPSLVAGQLSRATGLLQVTIGYSVLVLGATAVVLAAARNPSR
jgi:hypothetical protein